MNTNEIVLIDLSSIAYPIWHTSQSEPDPNSTSTKIVERVRTLAANHRHVAVCCDAGRSFRRDVSAEYKANRPERDATLVHQINLAIERLSHDGFPIWTAPGYEADDVVASAAMWALRQSFNVLVISSDKDLLQLVTEPGDGRPMGGDRSVRVMSAVNGNLMTVAAVGEKFGVSPAQMCDYLMLVGDASDNVKGAKGIGPAKAAGLLSKFGTLDRLYEELEARGGAAVGLTPALLQSLREFQGAMAVTRQLIALRVDVSLPFDEVLAERVSKDVETYGEGFGADDDDGLDDALATLPKEAKETPKPTRLAPVHVAPAETVAPAVVSEVIDEAKETASPHRTVPAVPAPPVDHASTTSAVPVSDSDQALVVKNPESLVVVPYERQLDPSNLRQAETLAKYMHQSQLFSGYGSPQAVLSTIMLGRELGLPAIASLRGVHIIEGKHSLSAQMMVALVMRSGLAEYFEPVSFSLAEATFVTKRVGARREVTLQYTVEHARLAGLLKKDSNWERRPEEMCIARAQARLCRLVYADVVGGLYTPDELIEMREKAA